MSSVWFRDFQDKTRATYWYLPLLMSLLGAILAIVFYWISQLLPSSLLNSWRLLPSMTTVDSARSALTTIGETTIGVIGVVFSITLVPLTIASSQYGSVIMRCFMRDRATQLVLGAYGATTFYSLILMTILSPGTVLSNARLPVGVGFCMLLLDLVILFYFIHHVADSLQAASVIEVISKELEDVIKEYPLARAIDTFDSRQTEVNVLRDTVLREGKAIMSDGEGYVRAIDYSKLMRIAVNSKSVLYLRKQSGDFVSRGDQLLLAYPGPLDEGVVSNVNRAYFLGGNRTLYQDAEYGIYIIVTIAVRALSQAINDPVTPSMCLNRMGAALGMLAERINPSPYFCDKENQLRIIGDPVSFERLVGVAFNMIREYGRGNAEVLMKMLETIRIVSAHARTEAQRRALLKHATLIEHDSHIGLASEYDQQRVKDSYDEALKAIGLTDGR